MQCFVDTQWGGQGRFLSPAPSSPLTSTDFQAEQAVGLVVAKWYRVSASGISQKCPLELYQFYSSTLEERCCIFWIRDCEHSRSQTRKQGRVSRSTFAAKCRRPWVQQFQLANELDFLLVRKSFGWRGFCLLCLDLYALLAAETADSAMLLLCGPRGF